MVIWLFHRRCSVVGCCSGGCIWTISLVMTFFMASITLHSISWVSVVRIVSMLSVVIISVVVAVVVTLLSTVIVVPILSVLWFSSVSISIGSVIRFTMVTTFSCL